ncbi:MAG: hypothetical protein BGO32_05870 [Bacteroidetes bacterium 37-13]|nr:MAG: hypothetical protein BGO32_05870 [Bacteroidetes bacterium 37-13]
MKKIKFNWGQKKYEYYSMSSLITAVFIALFFSISLSSCFKEKTLKPKQDGQHDKRIVIPMTPTYKNMYFFSLQSGAVVKESDPALYDLMFDNISGKFSIWLNGSKLMMIKRSGKTEFEKVTYSDTLATEGWLLDKPNYDIDSNAIGKWWSDNNGSIVSQREVYLINLGKDLLGNHLGYRKLQVESFAGNVFNIKFAFPDGSDEHTFSITQNNFTCYRYFSFQNGGELVEIEPAKETWDIVFSRYSYVFYDPYYLPYIVVGGLSNPQRIESYVDSTVSYTDFKLTDLNNNYFSASRDVIGYDWKKYDFTEYKTSPYRIYFFKTAENQFYKLHFLDFYNEKFERGYPTFEYEEL